MASGPGLHYRKQKASRRKTICALSGSDIHGMSFDSAGSIFERGREVSYRSGWGAQPHRVTRITSRRSLVAHIMLGVPHKTYMGLWVHILFYSRRYPHGRSGQMGVCAFFRGSFGAIFDAFVYTGRRPLLLPSRRWSLIRSASVSSTGGIRKHRGNRGARSHLYY